MDKMPIPDYKKFLLEDPLESSDSSDNVWNESSESTSSSNESCQSSDESELVICI